MNAKEYLSQIRDMDEVIRKDILEKDTWLSLATSLSVDPAGEKNNPNRNTHAPYEKCIENADELERRITANIDALADLKIKIAEEIQQLEEHDDVIILMMRYIAMMKWEEIEDKFIQSEATVMRKHNAALQHFEEKHGKI